LVTFLKCKRSLTYEDYMIDRINATKSVLSSSFLYDDIMSRREFRAIIYRTIINDKKKSGNYKR